MEAPRPTERTDGFELLGLAETSRCSFEKIRQGTPTAGPHYYSPYRKGSRIYVGDVRNRPRKWSYAV